MAPTPFNVPPSVISFAHLAIRADQYEGENSPGDVGDISPEPEAFPEYKFPGWGIALGALCVIATCAFFGWVCTYTNRQSRRKALLLEEYPCLDGLTHLASQLARHATSTALLPQQWVDNELGPVQTAPAIDEKSAGAPFGIDVRKIKMPTKLKQVVGKMGRRIAREEGVEGVAAGMMDMKPVDMSTTKLEPKDEVKILDQGLAGELPYQRPVEKEELESGARPMANRLGRAGDLDVNDGADAICFVTEERLENVDLK